MADKKCKAFFCFAFEKKKKVSIFCQCFKIQTKKVNKKSKTTIENTKTKIVFETLTKKGNLFLSVFQILFLLSFFFVRSAFC